MLLKLSFQVVIGEHFVVPAYSKVSLYEQPTSQDSDEELEYADSSKGLTEISCMCFCLDSFNVETHFTEQT